MGGVHGSNNKRKENGLSRTFCVTESNPLTELAPAWELFKRRHRTAVLELQSSKRYKSEAIQDYRYSTAVHWDREARNGWYIALELHFGGRQVTVDWSGNIHDPVCIVNGVMMFS